MIARISYWHPFKSFGFARTTTGEDYFVHRRETAEGKNIPEGTDVEFTVGEFNSRPCAKNVRLLNQGVRDVVNNEQ